MMNVEFIASDFCFSRVARRQVRATPRHNEYEWVEDDGRGCTIRSGTCGGYDIPPNVQAAADAAKDKDYTYIRWL